jgi:hypothetical protein
MPKSLKAFLKSFASEILLQILDSEIETFELEYDNILSPNKKGELNVIKSFEEFCEKKRKGEKSEEKAKIVPIVLGGDILRVIERIFIELKEFISMHKHTDNSNIITFLSEIPCELNLINILNIRGFNDEHNLISYKDSEMLGYLSPNIIHSIKYREIAHMFTKFIIIICNAAVSCVIEKRQKYKVSINELKFIIRNYSKTTGFTNLIELNPLIDELFINLTPKTKKEPKPKKELENIKEAELKDEDANSEEAKTSEDSEEEEDEEEEAEEDGNFSEEEE